MYRAPGQRDPNEAPPAELVYVAVGDDARRLKPGPGRSLLLGAPVLLGAALSAAATPTAGLLGMLGAAAGIFWLWRRAPHDGAILRVEGGALSVRAHGAKRATAHVALRDLLDVVLDTRTIERVDDGNGVLPALGAARPRVGATVDVARIVLVRRELAPLPLSDARGASIDATEQVGKIRVFLRAHGWVPEDERDEPDDAADA